MLPRNPDHLGQMLDVFEAKCRAQTRASYAASHGGADYDELMTVNPDEPVPEGEVVTFFHSRVLPNASLRKLAASVLRARVGIERTTISIAVVLMLRYNAKQERQPVTAHMMHRLFVACVLVGAKAHQDTFPCNKLLGKAVGVTLAETNRMEVSLVSALDWRIVVTQHDVNGAVASLALNGPTFGHPASGDSAYVPRDDRGNTTVLPLIDRHGGASATTRAGNMA